VKVSDPPRPPTTHLIFTRRDRVHDQLFKELLQEFFADFVQIVLPKIAPRLRLDRATFLDKETFTDTPEGEHRLLDLVAQVETTDGEEELLLVHVEIEARARPKLMGRRMWRYAMQLWLREHRHVVPIVLYLRGGQPGVQEITVEHRFADHQLASFTYWAFGLSHSQAADYLDRPETLAPALAALMDPGALSIPRHRIECLRRVGRVQLDDAKRFLLVNIVETYVQLDEAAQREYERLLAAEPNEEVKIMEMSWAETKIAEGMEKGLEKGLEKGRMEGIRSSVMDLLERRFGPLTERTKERVLAVSSAEELSGIFHRAIDARSLEEIGL
jgi:hypothetical protein